MITQKYHQHAFKARQEQVPDSPASPVRYVCECGWATSWGRPGDVIHIIARHIKGGQS